MKEEIGRKARLAESKAGDEGLSVSAKRTFVYAWLQSQRPLPDEVIRETFQIILNQ